MRRILSPMVLVLAVALILVVREGLIRQDSTDIPVTPDIKQSDDSSDTSLSETGLPGSISIEAAKTVDDSVRAYISRLADRNYTETYGEDFIWYVAAEELGMIGRPAIPALIERLGTNDDFERTQALYALRLAAQHPNMREVTGGEYVDVVPDAFPQPEEHPELVREWRAWYERYEASITSLDTVGIK